MGCLCVKCKELETGTGEHKRLLLRCWFRSLDCDGLVTHVKLNSQGPCSAHLHNDNKNNFPGRQAKKAAECVKSKLSTKGTSI